ncbi:hypothetical protein TNCV_1932581 [Trichonephila clavipes]|nr:hypothetical protein TNCV_1932581 [Trichonephila clavipes]
MNETCRVSLELERKIPFLSHPHPQRSKHFQIFTFDDGLPINANEVEEIVHLSNRDLNAEIDNETLTKHFIFTFSTVLYSLETVKTNLFLMQLI